MPEPDAVDEDDLRRSCTRFLSWHGMRRPADLLAELPDDIAPDRYGDGGAVTELEAEVSSLLGKTDSGRLRIRLLGRQGVHLPYWRRAHAAGHRRAGAPVGV